MKFAIPLHRSRRCRRRHTASRESAQERWRRRVQGTRCKLPTCSPSLLGAAHSTPAFPLWSQIPRRDHPPCLTHREVEIEVVGKRARCGWAGTAGYKRSDFMVLSHDALSSSAQATIQELGFQKGIPEPSSQPWWIGLSQSPQLWPRDTTR